jgi:transposase
VFVRRKLNKSGLVSVQVIDKSSGRYRVVHTCGNAREEKEIAILVQRGEDWIRAQTGIRELDFTNEQIWFASFADGIQQVNVVGPELLLGGIFDEIGFNKIKDILFRKLVISRLSHPASKLKTTEIWSRYESIGIDSDQVYRYLDKLNNKQKDIVEKISYDHTLQVLGGKIAVVFYDVTTLYFETDHEDELRKTGFSKDGKHQHPQIVLGLLVSTDGYPLAYDVFEGNKFEGHTMLPVIDGLCAKHKLDKLVVIADSGLLSKDNIIQLQAKGYQYILGARIKNMGSVVSKQILALKLTDGQSALLELADKTHLIIGYSRARAAKDKANREKGIRRLEKQIKTGKLGKNHINNRGYNKFLQLEGKLSVKLDQSKIDEDASWDGLKGYTTNTTLTKEEVISNYRHLWKIEKAFRISKTDLKIRPVYHRLERRIKAHICIAFVAYKIYKELERQLNEKSADLSPEQAIEIAKTIYQLKVITPINRDEIIKTLIISTEQRKLATLFNLKT